MQSPQQQNPVKRPCFLPYSLILILIFMHAILACSLEDKEDHSG